LTGALGAVEGLPAMTKVRSEVSSSSSGVRIREGVVSALNDPVWYISRDDHRHGPFSADQFARFEEAGTLRPTDQVWETGMDTWIEYKDYVARESASRSERAHRQSASGLADNQKCAICHLLRRGMLALAAIMTTALQAVSTFLAKIPSMRASSPAAEGSEHISEGTARPPADPHPASTHPPLLGPHGPDTRRVANGQVIRHPAGSVIDHNVKQDQDSAMQARTEDFSEALPRSPSSIPRLASEREAAAQIGLDLATFRAWVAEGRLPRALPDCGKYDMKAIHLVLDRMSGIAAREIG
jgi:GYF domain 2